MSQVKWWRATREQFLFWMSEICLDLNEEASPSNIHNLSEHCWCIVSLTADKTKRKIDSNHLLVHIKPFKEKHSTESMTLVILLKRSCCLASKQSCWLRWTYMILDKKVKWCGDSVHHWLPSAWKWYKPSRPGKGITWKPLCKHILWCEGIEELTKLFRRIRGSYLCGW